jgi:hypothetical protein
MCSTQTTSILGDWQGSKDAGRRLLHDGTTLTEARIGPSGYNGLGAGV